MNWNVENIQAVYLNDKGRIGSGEQESCLIGTGPELKVDLRDGQQRLYSATVERVYDSPLGLMLLGVMLLSLCVLSYTIASSYGLLFILTIILFGPMLRYQVNMGEDYIAHVIYAAMGIQDFNALPPHFLYHITLIGLSALFPHISLENLSFIIILASYVATSMLVFITIKWMLGSFLPDRSTILSLIIVGFALGMLLIGPISFLRGTFNRSALIFPNTYHNPTIAVLKPIALALFLCLANNQVGTERRPWREVALLFVLTIVATLAKPNYTLALIPAMSLFLGYSVLKSRRVNWRIVVGVILPAVLLLGWQYLFLYGPAKQSTVYATNQTTQIVLAPFELYRRHWRVPYVWLFPDWLMSTLFPLAVYCLYFPRTHRDWVLNLAWLVFFMGAAAGYLFVEVPGQGNGNLTWGGQVTLFILFVISVGFLMRQNYALVFKNQKVSPKFAVCLAIFALHLVSSLVVLI